MRATRFIPVNVIRTLPTSRTWKPLLVFANSCRVDFTCNNGGRHRRCRLARRIVRLCDRSAERKKHLGRLLFFISLSNRLLTTKNKRFGLLLRRQHPFTEFRTGHEARCPLCTIICSIAIRIARFRALHCRALCAQRFACACFTGPDGGRPTTILSSPLAGLFMRIRFVDDGNSSKRVSTFFTGLAEDQHSPCRPLLPRYFHVVRRMIHFDSGFFYSTNQ